MESALVSRVMGISIGSPPSCLLSTTRQAVYWIWLIVILFTVGNLNKLDVQQRPGRGENDLLKCLRQIIQQGCQTEPGYELRRQHRKDEDVLEARWRGRRVQEVHQLREVEVLFSDEYVNEWVSLKGVWVFLSWTKKHWQHMLHEFNPAMHLRNCSVNQILPREVSRTGRSQV